jgi:hypothetical protein
MMLVARSGSRQFQAASCAPLLQFACHFAANGDALAPFARSSPTLPSRFKEGGICGRYSSCAQMDFLSEVLWSPY